MTTNAAPSPPAWYFPVVFSCLAVLCGGLYLWTMDFPMDFDDEYYLIENPSFQESAGFRHYADPRAFVRKPVLAGTDPDQAANIMLRPFAYWTFHLNHAHAGFTPRWYRLANIAIHCASSMLVCCLVVLLLRGVRRAAPPSGDSIMFIAAAAAILFAVHPMAPDSVTYIVQRFTSMAAFFFLASLVMHFQANGARGALVRVGLRVGSVLAALLGMLTKECVFVLPVIAVLLDWLLVGSRPMLTVRRAAPLLLCLPLIPAQVLWVSIVQSGGNWSIGKAFDIVASRDFPIGHADYIVTQTTVVLDYLRQIVWPTGLCIDPEWSLHTSWRDAPVLLALAGWSGLILCAIWLFRRRRTDVRAAMPAVFLLWFLLTVVVSSGLVPLPDLKADHRAYLPSIGICILIASVFDGLRKRLPGPARRAFWAAAATVLVVLCHHTRERNEIWRDGVSLWEDAAAKSPGKWRVWNNLGASYGRAGRIEDSVIAFRQAERLFPQAMEIRRNLAVTLAMAGRWQEVLDLLVPRPGEASRGVSPEFQYQIARAHFSLGRSAEARRILEDLARAVPGQHAVHQLLGSVLLQMGHRREALHHLRAAFRLRPDDTPLLSLIEETETVLADGASSS